MELYFKSELVESIVEEKFDAVLDAVVCVGTLDEREDDARKRSLAEAGPEVLVLMNTNQPLESQQHRDENVTLPTEEILRHINLI